MTYGLGWQTSIYYLCSSVFIISVIYNYVFRRDKGTLSRKNINLTLHCILGEYSSGQLETKNRSVTRFFTELLQILLLKTCIVKNNTF